ncbi:hypothetical protein FRC00_010874 [Tulasnella sp. 408]|nr:hypothetical protein FRC00_010874 [Tulasnella sp. 408]
MGKAYTSFLRKDPSDDRLCGSVMNIYVCMLRPDTASAKTGRATLEIKPEFRPIAPLDEVVVEAVEAEAVAEAAAAEDDADASN